MSLYRCPLLMQWTAPATGIATRPICEDSRLAANVASWLSARFQSALRDGRFGAESGLLSLDVRFPPESPGRE